LSLKDNMDFLWQNMPRILTATSGVCGLLSACGVPGTGIAALIVKAAADSYSNYVSACQLSDIQLGQNQVKSMVGELNNRVQSGFKQFNESMSGQLSGIQLGQNQVKSMVGELSGTVKSGFEQLNNSFAQVFGELEAIESQLAGQREIMSQVLEVITDLRYKAGIEKIEAAFDTLMKGSHNLKSTLDALKGYIFELNTENSQNLNIKKIREYLELVRREKGKKAAEELGSYVMTVKGEYLIIVTLYYSYDEDHKRVQREYEDFNRDAMEIIKYAGLADIYDGEERDGLKHGKGSVIYKSGALYEGEWLNDKRCGHGKYKSANGEVYEGAWLNDSKHGQGKKTWANGDVYDGEWLNNWQHGKGKMKYANGFVYEGAWLNGSQHGHAHLQYSNWKVYEGEFKNGVS
jgi:hypothetical protein